MWAEIAYLIAYTWGWCLTGNKVHYESLSPYLTVNEVFMCRNVCLCTCVCVVLCSFNMLYSGAFYLHRILEEWWGWRGKGSSLAHFSYANMRGEGEPSWWKPVGPLRQRVGKRELMIPLYGLTQELGGARLLAQMCTVHCYGILDLNGGGEQLSACPGSRHHWQQKKKKKRI